MQSRAEPDGTDDTALLAEPLLKWEKITAAGPDGGYGDAGTGAAGGLRWPEKDGYDYTCHRTKAVKMRRTYYRKGKKSRP